MLLLLLLSKREREREGERVEDSNKRCVDSSPPEQQQQQHISCVLLLFASPPFCRTAGHCLLGNDCPPLLLYIYKILSFPPAVLCLFFCCCCKREREKKKRKTQFILGSSSFLPLGPGWLVVMYYCMQQQLVCICAWSDRNAGSPLPSSGTKKVKKNLCAHSITCDILKTPFLFPLFYSRSGSRSRSKSSSSQCRRRTQLNRRSELTCCLFRGEMNSSPCRHRRIIQTYLSSTVGERGLRGFEHTPRAPLVYSQLRLYADPRLCRGARRIPAPDHWTMSVQCRITAQV